MLLSLHVRAMDAPSDTAANVLSLSWTSYLFELTFKTHQLIS